MDFKVNSSHPESTAAGAVYAPGSQFSLTTEQANDPYNAERIGNGVFVPVDPNSDIIGAVPPYTGLKGFCFHGRNADAARPHGYASVEWMGSVVPNNALPQDTKVMLP